MWRPTFVFLAVMLVAPNGVLAQSENDIKELKLRDWQPRSMLITKATSISRAAFPVVDVHNHLGGGKATLTPARVKRYLEEMDSAGVRAVVNLDGGWGERLNDEYFDPAGGHHRQGFWMIYGVFLPRDVLEKIYFKNAERLLVGLKRVGESPGAR